MEFYSKSIEQVSTCFSAILDFLSVKRIAILACCPFLMGGAIASESEATETSETETSEILFIRHVEPIFREKCLGCHGAEGREVEGSFQVNSLGSLKLGGDSGVPSIRVGDPMSSPLYLAVLRNNADWSAMPPKNAERLTDAQVEKVSEWIQSGAVWPDADRIKSLELRYADRWTVEDGVQVTTSGGLDDAWTNRRYAVDGLWAYQPVVDPFMLSDTADQLSSPASDAGLSHPIRNPIDILLEQSRPNGLEIAKRADRRTLIRRASFDLTGLPPDPKAVEEFCKDPRTDREAFASVIDGLLQSPHYGERMAQHWLDVVRYADSSGFANDFQRGNAWRYRDYVVRAFNHDKPYDQFVREQIAGDEFVGDDSVEVEKSESLVATGFLRMGPWELTGMEVAKVARQRFLDDVTNSVGEVFLGHSLQCARCHDHKFDPIPTRDYYSIQAVFATTQLTERKMAFLENENLNNFEEQVYLHRREAEHQERLKQLDQVLLDNAGVWFTEHGLGSDGARALWDQEVERLIAEKGLGGVFGAVRQAMRKAEIEESLYPPKSVGLSPEQFGLERVARKGIQRLQWEFDRYNPFALSVYSGVTPRLSGIYAPFRIPENHLKNGDLEQSAILTGGDPFSVGAAVKPGILSVLREQVDAEVPVSIEGRRASFAEWVADASNPLTTRVIVNRIWMWHFGRALAGNPNNFGSSGKRPTHPKLLDWLASTFVRQGWSIKSMHRQIMLSDAYARRSEHPNVGNLERFDPKAETYAVFQPRRLTAEEMRDAMLSVSGELNPEIGGIPCRPEINAEVALQPRQVMGAFAAAWTPHPLPAQRHRRSVYILKLRGLLDPMLEVFNVPSPDFSCEQRDASTITPQAFALFNGKSSHARALGLASRVLEESDSDIDAVKMCFDLCFARRPSGDEVDEILKHWAEIEQGLSVEAPKSELPPLEVVRVAVEENTGEKFSFTERLYSNEDFVPDLLPSQVDRHVRAFADVCLVLLNSNEFAYVY